MANIPDKVSLIDRSTIPPNRVFFSWYINNECNYSCSYCKPQEYKTTFLSVERWFDIWTDIYQRYGSCQIHISGGEPFLYPNFICLISNLSKIHTLEFSTNLSWEVNKFIENISPQKARIGLSFHPEFADLEEFFNKVVVLRNAGFETWVNYVGYPPILKDMPRYRNKFKEMNLPFNILPFSGDFDGRKYPEGYTPEEKKCLMIFDKNEDVNKKTIDWRTDEVKSSTKGRLCRMGQMYARIYPNTDVSKCCGNEAKKLGNLLNDKLTLLETPEPCECEQCPCWRCMLVGKEDEFKKHWVIPFAQTSPDKIKIGSQDKQKINIKEKNGTNLEFYSKSRSKFSLSNTNPIKKQDIPANVFFTWDIHYFCNYYCTYCFLHFEPETANIQASYLDPEEWIKIWEVIYKKYGHCQISITGGEPFIYPQFIDLIANLQDWHTFEFSTNLSWDIEQFIKKIRPDRVRVNSSFHQEFVEVDIFLKKLLQLRENNYQVSVTVVAYPPFLEDISVYKSKFEEKGFNLTIFPYRGPYENKKYPEGYSDKEKALLKQLGSSIETEANKDLYAVWVENKQERKPEAVCRMGQLYAKIVPDGRTYRCCAAVHKDWGCLGNIVDSTFSLKSEPAMCLEHGKNCVCFRAMILGEEDKWLKHWNTVNKNKPVIITSR